MIHLTNSSMTPSRPLLYIHYPKGSLAFIESETQSHQQRMTECSISPPLSRTSSSSPTTSISLPTSNDASLVVAEDRRLAHRRSLPLSISISSLSQTSLTKKNEEVISGLMTPASPSTNNCNSAVQAKVMFYEAATAAAASMIAAPLTPVSPVFPVSLASHAHSV